MMHPLAVAKSQLESLLKMNQEHPDVIAGLAKLREKIASLEPVADAAPAEPTILPPVAPAPEPVPEAVPPVQASPQGPQQALPADLSALALEAATAGLDAAQAKLAAATADLAAAVANRAYTAALHAAFTGQPTPEG